MTQLHNWTPFVEQVGWTLLHSAWQLAAVAVFARVLSRLMSRVSASARYFMLVSMLALCVAAPVVTWIIIRAAPATSLMPVNSTVNHDSLLDAVPELNATAEADNPSIAAGVSTTADAARALTESDASPSISIRSFPSRFQSTLQPWLKVIVFGWLTGTCLFALRPALGYWTVWRLRTHHVQPGSQAVMSALARASRRIGLSCQVSISESALAKVPMVIGYFRPVILVPVSVVAGLPTAQLEAILVHELAHIRRHDYLLNIAQTLIETVFFYHPAVWWLSHVIRVERENCCDDMAVAALGSQIAYGRALLALEDVRGFAPTLALGANGSLANRIRRLAGVETQNRSFDAGSMFLAVVVLATALGIWVVAVAAEPDQEPSGGDTNGSVERSVPSDPSASTPNGQDKADNRTRGDLNSADVVGQPDRLPTLKVRTIDDEGKPIKDASVWVYDPASTFGRGDVAFELIHRTTAEDGWADFGQLPQNGIRVQVGGKGYANSYTVIGKVLGRYQHAPPERHFAKISTTPDTLRVEFTMLQSVDLNFDVVDAETDETVWWPEIYFHDAERWWTLAVIDGSGQHDFSPMFAALNSCQLRVAAAGYKPVNFRLAAKLETGKPVRQRIEMQPQPKTQLQVLTPNGLPAAGASFRWGYPNGLDYMALQDKKADDRGRLETEYHPHADLGSVEITHASGWAKLALKDLSIDGVIRLQPKASATKSEAGSTDNEKEKQTRAAVGEPESWEITRIYGKEWLRGYFMRDEVLPKLMVVPAIRGKVIDGKGNAITDATIVSHTPRQWLNLHKVLSDPRNGPPQTKSRSDGGFGLPSRTEPYRVLVQHDSGVASMSHEELIRARGTIVLRPWASVEGVFELEGKPVANAKILLRPYTLSWSYSTGGPRLTGDFNTVTDAQGRFRFSKIPPLPGRMFHHDTQLARGIQFESEPGKTTKVELGRGTTVAGRLRMPAGEVISRQATRVSIEHVVPAVPYPPELANSRDRDARTAWYRKWYGTDEGLAVSARREYLTNSNYYAIVNSDGAYRVAGVPPGEYQLVVRHKFTDSEKHTAQIMQRFKIDGSAELMRLGDVAVSVPDSGLPSDPAPSPKRSL